MHKSSLFFRVLSNFAPLGQLGTHRLPFTTPLACLPGDVSTGGYPDNQFYDQTGKCPSAQDNNPSCNTPR